MIEPVFIVGCARSGTSIFGETIAAHPRVVYLYEVSALWRRLFPDGEDDRLGPEDAANETAAAELRDEFERELRKGRGDVLVEKNPKHALRVAFLDRLFPRARFLHIIRDGRDTVASLMFRNRGAEWGHLRIRGWKELLERHPEANHVRCAHQWREAVTTARREGRALGNARYRELRYEELVAAPERVMEACLKFVGLEMTEQIREAAARIQDETARSYHARKQVRHYVDNHARRIGRYRENLDERQLAQVEDVIGELLGELGY